MALGFDHFDSTLEHQLEPVDLRQEGDHQAEGAVPGSLEQGLEEAEPDPEAVDVVEEGVNEDPADEEDDQHEDAVDDVEDGLVAVQIRQDCSERNERCRCFK